MIEDGGVLKQKFLYVDICDDNRKERRFACKFIIETSNMKERNRAILI